VQIGTRDETPRPAHAVVVGAVAHADRETVTCLVPASRSETLLSNLTNNGTGPDLMGAIGNGAGLPAVIIPNGVGSRGLPTSLVLIGRASEENTILAAAGAYQPRTDWHRRHPPVA
jgi:Asp-tRNA(Asn)/Glu-tRNA(Gln) amidotransferase A subunit family amidase